MGAITLMSAFCNSNHPPTFRRKQKEHDNNKREATARCYIKRGNSFGVATARCNKNIQVRDCNEGGPDNYAEAYDGGGGSKSLLSLLVPSIRILCAISGYWRSFGSKLKHTRQLTSSRLRGCDACLVVATASLHQ
jgi:hypothetical protein